MTATGKKDRNWITIVLFLLPVGLLYGVFFLYPIGFLLVASLAEWNGIQPMVFSGLSNFAGLFTDSVFQISIKNNVIWALSAAFLQVFVALSIALILARKPRGWRFFRNVFFLPNVISAVALSMMWIAMYNSEFGLINHLLIRLGLEKMTHNWLGEIKTALPAVIFSHLIYVGYFMLIILAGAMSLPGSFFEAAQMDGANVFQQEIYITLPAIRGTLLTTVTLSVAFSLRQFEETYIMTNGGPANSTPVMGLVMYKKMAGLHYGQAAAIGVILIVLGILIVGGLQMLFGRSDAVQESRQ